MAKEQGTVYWFTGLSGSGKTTTANHVMKAMQAEGIAVELLDGDHLRETICKGLGFSREDRFENISRIVYIAQLLARNGINVLVSAITPYQEMRDYARQQLPSFVEIYVECSLEECERRDVKGLYARARNNEIAQFTGISDQYDVPKRPEMIINTVHDSLEVNSARIMRWRMEN